MNKEKFRNKTRIYLDSEQKKEKDYIGMHFIADSQVSMERS